MSFFTILFILFSCNLIQCKIKVVSHEPLVQREIKQFIQNYKLNMPKGTTNFIIRTKYSHIANDILNWYLKNNQNGRQICNGDFNVKSFKSKRTLSNRNIFIFTDFGDAKLTIKELKKCCFWWSRSNMFFFILSPSGVYKKPITKFIKKIWLSKVHNFVVIYLNSLTRKINVLTYNEFLQNPIGNLTGKFNVNFFPNKLTDMNGQVIKMGIYLESPRLVKNALGQWKGRDVNLVKSIKTILNASIKFIEIPEHLGRDGLYRYVLDGTIDFGVNRHFKLETDNFSNVDVTYPRRIEKLVAAVEKPQKIPQFLYMFMIFDSNILIMQLSCLFLIALALLIPTSGKKTTFTTSLLESWRSLLFSSVPDFHRLSSPKKILLTIWFQNSLIFLTIFQGYLISTVTTPKYSNVIDTLEELRESKIKINCHRKFRNFVHFTHNLEEQFVYSSSSKMRDIYNGRTNTTGFMTALSMAYSTVNLYDTYRIVEEPVAHGYNVHMLQEDSPYTDEIRKCILIDQEFGLSARLDHIDKLPKSSRAFRETDDSKLTVKQLKGVLLVLTGGYFLSIVVFVIEILIGRKKY